jgi:hypothetical protein
MLRSKVAVSFVCDLQQACACKEVDVVYLCFTSSKCPTVTADADFPYAIPSHQRKLVVDFSEL